MSKLKDETENRLENLCYRLLIGKKYRRKPMRWGWGLGGGRAAQANEVRGERDAV